jgi:SAM-dependent methyltransferase
VSTAKARAIEQWTADPAGAHLASGQPEATAEFYREAERTRYDLYPWLRGYLTPGHWQGRRTLEIGVGLGTDHLSLYRAGASLVGIDLTPASVEHTKRRFAFEGATSDVRVADAERLPFGEGSFDGVYSFGVLHHSPDMRLAAAEIHRVLRPGGLAIVGLYNRHSYFHAWRLLRHFGSGAWRRSGLDAMRANFEHGAGSPLVILSSRREIRAMFGAFTRVAVTARHLPTDRLPAGLRPVADRALRPIERNVGWYWMVVAYR